MTSNDAQKVALCISSYFTETEHLVVASTKKKPTHAGLILDRLSKIESVDIEKLVIDILYCSITDITETAESLEELIEEGDSILQLITAAKKWTELIGATQSRYQEPDRTALAGARKDFEQTLKVKFTEKQRLAKKQKKNQDELSPYFRISELNAKSSELIINLEDLFRLIGFLQLEDSKLGDIPLSWRTIRKLIKNQQWVLVNSENDKNQSAEVQIIEAFFYTDFTNTTNPNNTRRQGIIKPFGTGLIATPKSVTIWTALLVKLLAQKLPIYVWSVADEAATWDGPRYFVDYGKELVYRSLVWDFESVFEGRSKNLTFVEELEYLEKLKWKEDDRLYFENKINEAKERRRDAQKRLCGISPEDLEAQMENIEELNELIDSLTLKAEESTAYPLT